MTLSEIFGMPNDAIPTMALVEVGFDLKKLVKDRWIAYNGGGWIILPLTDQTTPEPEI